MSATVYLPPSQRPSSVLYTTQRQTDSRTGDLIATVKHAVKTVGAPVQHAVKTVEHAVKTVGAPVQHAVKTVEHAVKTVGAPVQHAVETVKQAVATVVPGQKMVNMHRLSKPPLPHPSTQVVALSRMPLDARALQAEFNEEERKVAACACGGGK